MKTKALICKILFITLPSIVVFLIVIEIGLRAAGYVYTRYRHPGAYSQATVPTPGTFNILCLGDSFTQGAGAIHEDSYPKQLERLLQKNINKNIIITNKGKGCSTSSLLLDNLEKVINEYKPQLIIVMVGINNRWNYDESSYFHLYKDYRGFWGWLDKNFSNWRVYKLIKIISLGIKSKTDNNPMKGYNEDRIRNILMASIKLDSLDVYNVGFNFWLQGKFDLARQKYIEALNIDSRNYVAYLGLARIDVDGKQYLLAKEEIWKAIHTLDSKAHAYYVNVIFNLLDQFRDNLINPQFELMKIKEYLKNNYRGDDKKILLRAIDAKLNIYEDENILAEVINYDLKEIIKISKNRGVAIVLQTYPRNWYSLFNNAIRQISKDYNIALVDNERIFEEEAKLMDIEDLFVPDGHCNAKGYGIIAENTYKALIEHKLLPDNKYDKSLL